MTVRRDLTDRSWGAVRSPGAVTPTRSADQTVAADICPDWSRRSSSRGQQAVDDPDRDRALTDGGRHALHGAVSDLADREHSGDARLQRQRRATGCPARVATCKPRGRRHRRDGVLMPRVSARHSTGTNTSSTRARPFPTLRTVWSSLLCGQRTGGAVTYLHDAGQGRVPVVWLK